MVVDNCFKPVSPTIDGGFICCHKKTMIPVQGRLDALAIVALVGNQDIWEFVVYSFTISAPESANDQYVGISKAVNKLSRPAAYNLKRSSATWAIILLRAPYKKHPVWSFQLADNRL